MEHVFYYAIIAGVMLVAIALAFRIIRLWIGYGLLLLGLALCISAIGMPLGIPTMLFGGMVVVYETHNRRKLKINTEDRIGFF